MTFQNVKATGNGSLEYRISIEGFPYDMVSSALLAGVSGSQTRINGLKRDTLRYNQNVDWINGHLDASNMSFEIVDLEGLPTGFFVRNPTKETFLASNISSTDTAIPVGSTSGWVAGDVGHLATEAFIVSVVDSATQFTVVRGYHGSTALAYQATDATLGNTNSYSITDRPLRIAGRRVNLYVYDSDDSLTGAGTLIWKGVLQSEIDLVDSAVYKLSAYSITEKLKSKLGVDLGDALTVRGFYFPAGFELYFRITELAGATNVSALPAGDILTNSIHAVCQGFYETKAAIVEDLNNQIDEQLSDLSTTWDSGPRFTVNGDGALMFQWTTGASPKWCRCFTFKGPLNRWTGPSDSFAAFVPDFSLDLNTRWFDELGSEVGTVAANNLYFGACEGTALAMSPVYTIGRLPRSASPLPDTYIATRLSGAATYPLNRLYLSAPAIPTNTYSIQAPFREFDGVAAPVFSITAVNNTDRYVDTTHDGRFPFGFIYSEADEFSLTTEYISEGNFFDFLESVVSNAIEYSSLGITPNLTEADIDLPEIRLLTSSLNMPPYLTNRSYSFGGKAIEFDKIVAEECKLYGIFPIINNNAKISFAKLREVSKSELSTLTLSSSVLRQLPGYTRQPDRVINVSELRTPYSPYTDDNNQNTYTVNYVDSIANFGGKKSTLSINPFSNFTGEDISQEDINSILWRPVATFGVPRSEITLEVGLNYFTATLGASLRVVSPYIPNPTNGLRGIDTIGMLRGIDWNLGQGKGKFTISLADNSFAGYAPNLEIVTSTADANPGFDFTVSGSRYAPYGRNDLDYFFAGDIVEVWQGNQWNELPLQGTASNINKTFGEISVTFPAVVASPNFMTASYIGFPPATGSANGAKALTEFQLRFCFVSSGSFESYLSKFGA